MDAGDAWWSFNLLLAIGAAIALMALLFPCPVEDDDDEPFY